MINDKSELMQANVPRLMWFKHKYCSNEAEVLEPGATQPHAGSE